MILNLKEIILEAALSFHFNEQFRKRIVEHLDLDISKVPDVDGMTRGEMLEAIHEAIIKKGKTDGHYVYHSAHSVPESIGDNIHITLGKILVFANDGYYPVIMKVPMKTSDPGGESVRGDSIVLVYRSNHLSPDTFSTVKVGFNVAMTESDGFVYAEARKGAVRFGWPDKDRRVFKISPFKQTQRASPFLDRLRELVIKPGVEMDVKLDGERRTVSGVMETPNGPAVVFGEKDAKTMYVVRSGRRLVIYTNTRVGSDVTSMIGEIGLRADEIGVLGVIESVKQTGDALSVKVRASDMMIDGKSLLDIYDAYKESALAEGVIAATHIPLFENYNKYIDAVDDILDRTGGDESMMKPWERKMMTAVKNDDWELAASMQKIMDTPPVDPDPMSDEESFRLMWDAQMDRVERLSVLDAIGHPRPHSDPRWDDLEPLVRTHIKNLLDDVGN